MFNKYVLNDRLYIIGGYRIKYFKLICGLGVISYANYIINFGVMNLRICGFLWNRTGS